MTANLTVDGYTFDNPPGDYRKIIQLSNNPQQVFRRQSSDFYQSDSQDVEVQVSGELSLNESSDLSELQTLQQKAINGGEVSVEFDPFFSGRGVITDNPFRQEDQRGQYDFTFKINSIDTDDTAFPSHATPQTGNTFELGSFDFGYDPDSVQQDYERMTPSVETLQGLNRTVDNKGLVPRVTVSGRTDGAGIQALWQKARNNSLSYLSAEFQNGWSLITRLQVGNDPDAPDFVTGLYQYSVDLLVVKDPGSGIGQVSSFIDHDIRDTGSYTADADSGDADAGTANFQVSSGSTDLSGQTVTWPATTVSVDLGLTNYVYVADPDNDGNGEVRVNQSAFPSNAAPLYEVYTGPSSITNVVDVREQDTSGGDDTATTIGFTVDAGSDSDAGVSWSKTVLELTASTTNYVYADGTTGDVTFNTSGFPAGDVALYEVQTDANSVDVVLDQRAGTTVGGDDTVDTLSYDVSGGTGAIDGNYVAWDFTTVELQYGATNYVYVVDPDNDGNGQVEVNQSAVPSDALGLWEVVTDGDGITSETDLRDSLVDDGDGGDSDLSFTDSLQVFDSDLTLTPFLSFADAFGIGTGALGPLANLNWSTATDWDNAVSESNVSHASDVVETEPVVDGFEDGSVSDTWDVNNLSAVQDRVFEGSYSAYTSNSSSGTYIARWQPSDLSGGAEIGFFRFYYQETTNQSGGGFRLLNSNGNVEFGAASDNDEYEVDGATGITQLSDGSGYDDWVRVTLTFDWSAGTVDVEFYNIPDDDTATGTFDLKQGVDVETLQFDDYSSGSWQTGDSMDMWIDNVTYLTEGTLTTATKSFASATKPNVEGLSYTLSGGTASIDVIGSPGTADEEVKTVSLTGQTEKPLSWTDDHADFRVKLLLEGANTTFDAVDLTDDDVQGELLFEGQADLSEPVPDPTDAPLTSKGFAKLLTQFAVADGGTASGPGGVTESVTWETQTDWDNAVSRFGIVGDNGTLSMTAAGQDDWEDQPTGGTLPAPWTDNGNPSIVSNRTVNGSRAIYYGGGGGDALEATFVDAPIKEVYFYYNETSSQGGGDCTVYNENGNRICRMGTGNAQRGVWHGNGDSGFGDPSDSYDAWYLWWCELDYTNNEVTFHWRDVNGGDSDIDIGPFDMENPATKVTNIQYGGHNYNHSDGWSTGSGSDMWGDLHTGIFDTGNLTTATKSFSGDVQPDLTDLSYTLNGQDVTLDVIGSPGTASEETKTVTLDGSSSFTLSWNATHTDFRIQVNMTCGDRQTSPTVDKLRLGGGGGGDADQNAQTNWELQPGQYDTSGNEYEGGGSTLKHA